MGGMQRLGHAGGLLTSRRWPPTVVWLLASAGLPRRTRHNRVPTPIPPAGGHPPTHRGPRGAPREGAAGVRLLQAVRLPPQQAGPHPEFDESVAPFGLRLPPSYRGTDMPSIPREYLPGRSLV